MTPEQQAAVQAWVQQLQRDGCATTTSPEQDRQQRAIRAQDEPDGAP